MERWKQQRRVKVSWWKVRGKRAKISLASTSESSGDDGGEPPRKKTRRDTRNVTANTTMQAPSNGCVQNGASSSNGAPATSENGHESYDVVALTPASQDIVRLIGQYLKNEGLMWVLKFLVFYWPENPKKMFFLCAYYLNKIQRILPHEIVFLDSYFAQSSS